MRAAVFVVLCMMGAGCTSENAQPCDLNATECVPTTAATTPTPTGPIDHRGGFVDNFSFVGAVGDARLHWAGSKNTTTLPHSDLPYTIHVSVYGPSGLSVTLIVNDEETDTGTDFTVEDVPPGAVLSYEPRASVPIPSGNATVTLTFCDLCFE